MSNMAEHNIKWKTKEFLIFDDAKIQKIKFHSPQKKIHVNEVDIKRSLPIAKVKKLKKYFIEHRQLFK